MTNDVVMCKNHVHEIIEAAHFMKCIGPIERLNGTRLMAYCKYHMDRHMEPVAYGRYYMSGFLYEEITKSEYIVLEALNC